MHDGKYLGHKICAFSGDSKSMWLIVWDGRYNYYLFNASQNENIRRFNNNGMPSNNSSSGNKYTEFYTVYDTAVKNLCKVVANGGFFDFTRSGVDGNKTGL